MEAENVTSRSEEADQVAGGDPTLRSATAQENAPVVQTEAFDKGDFDSNATWQAYRLFFLQTSPLLPMARANVAVRTQWTLALRRGLLLRALPPRLHRVY